MNWADRIDMRVRIIREPHGTVNGVSLRNYRAGEVYDIPSTLADYLILEEYAILEMRHRRVPVEVERRRAS
jgi:hypothetical protein